MRSQILIAEYIITWYNRVCIDHQYYHKWAMLANPRDFAAGAKGYVKCNIAVHAKGEKLKVPPDTDGDEDIEGFVSVSL